LYVTDGNLYYVKKWSGPLPIEISLPWPIPI